MRDKLQNNIVIVFRQQTTTRTGDVCDVLHGKAALDR